MTGASPSRPTPTDAVSALQRPAPATIDDTADSSSGSSAGGLSQRLDHRRAGAAEALARAATADVRAHRDERLGVLTAARRDAELDERRVGDLPPTRGAAVVKGPVARQREEPRAHAALAAVAARAAKRVEHRVLRDVVGRRVVGERPREASHGGAMPPHERFERGVVSPSDAVDQVAVV